MTFKNYSRYLMTAEINQWFVMFYYFPLFKQVPLDKLVNSKLKQFLVDLHFPFSIVMKIIKDLLYVGFMMLIASLLNKGIPFLEMRVIACSLLLFFMMMKRLSILFLDVPNRWTITRQLHVHPQDYYNISLLWYLTDRIIYSVVLFLITMNFGFDYGIMIALAPLLLSLQIELFVSLYFKRNEKKPSKLLHFTSLITSLSLVLTIIFVTYLNQGIFIVITFELITIVVFMFVLKDLNLAVEVQRYMINYMDINVNGEADLDKINKQSYRGDDVVIVEDLTQDFKQLQGYALLNKLFFKRHKRLWLKPLKITGYVFVATCGLIVIVRLFAEVFDPTGLLTLQTQSFDYNLLSAPLLFIIFITNRTEVLTKSMYFNCDYAFLHYPFYKQKEFIWKQYLVRFKSCILINLVQPLAFLMAILMAVAVGLIPFEVQSFIRLSLNLMFGNLIITALYLSLYYIFQPFTKDMTVKNGFYTFFTSATSFFFIYSREFLSYITTIIWAMPIVFIIVLTASLIGVSILSPRNFKYKN